METLIKFIGAQLTRQLRPVLAHGDLLREFDVVEKLPSDFREGLLQEEQIILYPKSRLTCPADPFGWLPSTKPAMEDAGLSARNIPSPLNSTPYQKYDDSYPQNCEESGDGATHQDGAGKSPSSSSSPPPFPQVGGRGRRREGHCSSHPKFKRLRCPPVLALPRPASTVPEK